MKQSHRGHKRAQVLYFVFCLFPLVLHNPAHGGVMESIYAAIFCRKIQDLSPGL